MTRKARKGTTTKAASAKPSKGASSASKVGSSKAGQSASGLHYVATVCEDESLSVTVLASPEGPALYSTRVNSLDEIG